MNYEELYTKASKGDESALEELVDYAEHGEADAQYWLSCLYEMDGPLKNEEQADYWLDMAAYNGNKSAKQKLYERPLKPIKNNRDEEEDFSENAVPNSSNGNVYSEEDRKRWRIRIIWWIIFPILFSLYYLHKCEEDAERDKAFKEQMIPLDQKSDNFNPSEHIQIDSIGKIKVDEQYIEHLKKKGKR